MSTTTKTERKRLFINSKKCNGCRICELRCSFAHEKVYSPSLARIRIHKWEIDSITDPKVCKQCGNPPCIRACEENALQQDPITGAIILISEKCTGCMNCAEACRFDAISPHPTINIVLICDLCSGDPQCARYCPEDAILFLTPTEMKARRKEEKLKQQTITTTSR